MTPDPAQTPPALVDAPPLPARCYRVASSPARFVLQVRPLEDRNIARAVRLAGRLVLAATFALSALGVAEDKKLAGVALFAWIFVVMYGAWFAIQVAPFDGSVVRTVRRSLTLVPAAEAAYRDGAPRGAALTVDGEPIEAGRLVRVAVGYLQVPGGGPPDLCTVNLVLLDGLVRVAKLRGEAPARRLAEALSSALGTGYDPAELPAVYAMPGRPEGWGAELVVAAGIFALVGAMVAGLFATRSIAGGFAAWTASALIVDVGLNDLLIARRSRRIAGEQARWSFGLRKDA
jgi:hypothetical protein